MIAVVKWWSENENLGPVASILPPLAIMPFWITVWPKECAHGKKQSERSSGSIGKTA